MSKVLVSVNFAGSYNKNNIGHEFINLFPDDDGNWHFYVPPYGIIKQETDDLDYLMLVQHIDRKYTLLALATNLKSTEVFSKKNASDIEKENDKNGEIEYFGKKLRDWFSNQKNTLFVSYNLNKDSKVYFPCKEVTIEFESLKKKQNCIYLPRNYYNKNKKHERKQITGQSLLSYYKVDNFDKQISKLKKEKYLVDKTEADFSREKNGMTYEKSILDIIGRPSDELAFSNWLNEFLQNDSFFDFFLKECCKINNRKQETKIRKSKLEQSTSNRNRIDLWLEDDEYIILIENKVQSSIHTSTTTDKEIGKSIVVSQLSDYLSKGKERAKNTNKTLKTFLMCPDYYSSYYYVENDSVKLWDKGENKEYWIEIKYSEIKKCLKNFINQKLKTNDEKAQFPYIQDYIKALEKHCKNIPFSMKDIILDRVARKK